MLLTITSTSSPATDLGYLLFKNPARVHGFDLSFGKATVFYPEATAERCTVCLLLEVDPIGMVRRKSGPAGDGGIFDQYVNDRPYVASSFLSLVEEEQAHAGSSCQDVTPHQIHAHGFYHACFADLRVSPRAHHKTTYVNSYSSGHHRCRPPASGRTTAPGARPMM